MMSNSSSSTGTPTEPERRADADPPQVARPRDWEAIVLIWLLSLSLVAIPAIAIIGLLTLQQVS